MKLVIFGGKVGLLGIVKSLCIFLLVEFDEFVNVDLVRILKDVVVNREVIVGICDSNVKVMV